MINKDQLVEIGKYILQGLSQDEAAILINVNPADLRESPSVKNFLEKQAIEFKLAHLKEIQAKKSSNSSQWLLEKLRPDEFGSKAKDTGTNINIISQIIHSIQNGEAKSKLAPTNRGELEQGREEDDNIRVLDVLN